jgi:hypothetical protein
MEHSYPIAHPALGLGLGLVTALDDISGGRVLLGLGQGS